MIIMCGKRRLVSYRYGWLIEIQQEVQSGENKGQIAWREDRPAYPASLTDALETLCERELVDGGDITLDQLPEALKQASSTVRKYMTLARAAA